MKKPVSFVSAAIAAIALTSMSSGATNLQRALFTGAAVSSPSILEDDQDGNEDGGVVDPVPQDDGSPGIDDPCAPPPSC